MKVKPKALTKGQRVRFGSTENFLTCLEDTRADGKVMAMFDNGRAALIESHKLDPIDA